MHIAGDERRMGFHLIEMQSTGLRFPETGCRQPAAAGISTHSWSSIARAQWHSRFICHFLPDSIAGLKESRFGLAEIFRLVLQQRARCNVETGTLPCFIFDNSEKEGGKKVEMGF